MKEVVSRWEQFASDNKLSLKSEGGELVAIGKLGSLYEYSDEEVGAMYSPATTLSKRGWRVCKDKLIAVGAVITQNGDEEGAVKFEYGNAKALRTACTILGIRNKRSLSPERKAANSKRLAEYRAKR